VERIAWQSLVAVVEPRFVSQLGGFAV
jgi:hypothetical protein